VFQAMLFRNRQEEACFSFDQVFPCLVIDRPLPYTSAYRACVGQSLLRAFEHDIAYIGTTIFKKHFKPPHQGSDVVLRTHGKSLAQHELQLRQ